MPNRFGRRGRAVAFAVAALLAAAAAAAIADGYGKSVARGYGELRPVLVAREALAAGEPIDAASAARALELRRVPVRFLPPDALLGADEAIGLAPAVAVPAGGYLLASQLRPPARPEAPGAGLAAGRRPVEIAVSGTAALTVAGADPVGSTVDLIVTTEPDSGGPGRTYLAATGVPLLAIGPGGGGPGGVAAATLGLTRSQALRLIAAESFARAVTVLPSQ